MYLLLLLVAVAVCSAQNNTITFYDRPNFRGSSVTYDCDKPHLALASDRSESAIVNGTVSWMVHDGDWYTGLASLLPPGQYPNHIRFPGGRNRVSSARQERPPPSERIVLFEQSNYRGGNVTIHCDAPYLGRFENRASSVKVYDAPYVVYDGPNYAGRRVTLLPGDYPNANFLPGDNRISSVQLGIA